MNIALIGPSGVGKGTHASLLIEKFNMLHLVTGDLLRQNLEQHTGIDEDKPHVRLQDGKEPIQPEVRRPIRQGKYRWHVWICLQ